MNKIKLWSISLILATSAIFAVSVSAQPSTSANFKLIQSAVAGGGGRSSSGTFTITGTIGQGVAGTQSSGGLFNATGGFWQQFFSPTAATVSISGHVLSTTGRGIPRTVVQITEQNGLIRTATTNQFGYFRFNGIEAGQVIIIDAFSKGFDFSPQAISVSENIDEIVLTAAYSKSVR